MIVSMPYLRSLAAATRQLSPLNGKINTNFATVRHVVISRYTRVTLTNSLGQRHSSEAISRTSNKEIPRVL
jgi:hypothetical protein